MQNNCYSILNHLVLKITCVIRKISLHTKIHYFRNKVVYLTKTYTYLRDTVRDSVYIRIDL